MSVVCVRSMTRGESSVPRTAFSTTPALSVYLIVPESTLPLPLTVKLGSSKMNSSGISVSVRRPTSTGVSAVDMLIASMMALP